FEENVDYLLVVQKCPTNNPKNPWTEITEYVISLDMAKELSMVQRTERGKQARQYFIECEKKAKQLVTDPLQLMKLSLQAIEQQQQELEAVKSDIEFLKTETTINSSQRKKYKKAVDLKVYEILGDKYDPVYKEFSKKLYSSIHNSVKNVFDVAEINDFPKVEFENVMKSVCSYALPRELELMILGYKQQLKLELGA
ncbi:MAG: ORF6C domain-containing protein, partial [Culicoidibacterales bacterium]